VDKNTPPAKNTKALSRFSRFFVLRGRAHEKKKETKKIPAEC
jgi:hypothetical protein